MTSHKGPGEPAPKADSAAIAPRGTTDWAISGVDGGVRKRRARARSAACRCRRHHARGCSVNDDFACGHRRGRHDVRRRGGGHGQLQRRSAVNRALFADAHGYAFEVSKAPWDVSGTGPAPAPWAGDPHLGAQRDSAMDGSGRIVVVGWDSVNNDMRIVRWSNVGLDSTFGSSD